MRFSLLSSVGHMYPLICPYMGLVLRFLLLGLTATLIEGVGIGLLIPLLQGQAPLVNTANPVLSWLDMMAGLIPQERRTLILTGLIFAAMAIKALLAYGFTLLLKDIASRGHRDSAEAMFSQVLRLSHSYLVRQPEGSLLHLLTLGPRDVGQSIQAFLWLLLNLASILVFAILLTAVAWQLTLVSLVLALVVTQLVRFATRRVKQICSQGLDMEKERTHLAKEGLLGMTTIRAFGQEKQEQNRYEEVARQAHSQRVKAESLVSLTHPMSELLGAALIMILVALALQTGIELPVLVAMAFMLYRIQPQLQNANVNLAVITTLQPIVESVQALTDDQDKLYTSSGSIQPSILAEGIRFDRVSFSYDQRGAVLNNVDCFIKRGESTALVGRSGAGKSTMINLICGFYEADSGQLLVDGISLQELDLRAWRSQLALVSQDIHIFQSTVRENIIYGRPEASETELLEAAKRAHAHDFISKLPEGYDTIVGERGVRLSGGQRQRISIARAFLRDPHVLILDEATNALDSLSEAHIQSALADLRKGRTLLVIAHRLATVRHADQILVLDQGKVAEQGRFEALLAANGQFAALYRNQHGDYL